MIHANRKGTTGISSECGFCSDKEGKNYIFLITKMSIRYTVPINCTFTSI